MRGMAEASRPRRRKSSRLRRLRPQPLRRIERRGDDILIAGATAEIAGNGDAHLLFGRVRIVAQELDERRQNPWRAEAALKPMVFMEGLLQGMQPVGRRRDALHGENIMAVRLHREHQAGTRRALIEEDRACPANAVLAAEMGAGEAELVAAEISQRHADLDFFLVPLAVDGQRDFPLLSHCPSWCGRPAWASSKRACAFSNARRDSTAARCWR